MIQLGPLGDRPGIGVSKFAGSMKRPQLAPQLIGVGRKVKRSIFFLLMKKPWGDKFEKKTHVFFWVDFDCLGMWIILFMFFFVVEHLKNR